MLWAVAFVILFTIGGFSGLMLAIVPADFQYHDTYFVVAHFHYVLVTGALFSIIAATYYWWPKWTGRMYSQFWAKVHFWWTIVFVNLLFFPQHFLGLAGMPRRIPDYNVAFADFNMISSIGGFWFGASQLLFVGVIVLILASVANMFLHLPALMLTVSVLAIVIFSAYMLFDVQRVVNGGETNYITATLAIYLDLYNVFTNLLALLGIFGGNRN